MNEGLINQDDARPMSEKAVREDLVVVDSGAQLASGSLTRTGRALHVVDRSTV